MGEEVVKKIWPINCSLVPRPSKCFLTRFLLNTALSVLLTSAAASYLIHWNSQLLVVQLTVLVIMSLKLGEEEKYF